MRVFINGSIAVFKYIMMSLICCSWLYSGSLAQKASPDSTYAYFSKHKDIPADFFAQANELTQVLLSPDGEHIFYIFPTGENLQMQVEPMEDETEYESYFSGIIPMDRYGGSFWVSNERLIVVVNSIIVNFESLIRRSKEPFIKLQRSILAFNVDDSTVNRLLTYEIADSSILVSQFVIDPLVHDKDNILISYSEDGESYPGVYKFNVFSGEMTRIVEPREPIVKWFTDYNGFVRFGFGVDEGGLIMITRASEQNEWEGLHDQELFKDDTFFPISFSFNENSMFVRSAVANGRFSIYDFDLNAGSLTEKLYEHPEVDVSGIEVSNGAKKLLAVTYQTDKLERQYFDDDYQKLMTSIDKTLTDRNNHLVDMTLDGQYMLIRSESAVFPGAYYRMDVKNKKLDLIGEFNTRLNPEYLAPKKKVSYFARDGLEIDAYLTIPKGVQNDENLPVVVMPHASVNGRDYNSYDYVVQFLASRGYAVFQPNYRGSSGYGFSYQLMGYGEWGRNIQNDITDGVKYLISSGIADKEKICISGASFAGYSAMLASFQTPELYKCAAALSPVTNLSQYVKSMRRSFGKEYQRRMIGDRSRREVRNVSPAHNIKEVSIPIFIMRGEYDRFFFNGPVETRYQTDKFVEKLENRDKEVEYYVIADEGEEFRYIKNRIFYLEELEKFFAKHLGVPEENEVIQNDVD